MKKKSRNLVCSGLSLLMLLLPVLVLGQAGGKTELPTTEQAVYDTINKAITWLFYILLLGAAIMIIIAAYTFLTAAGDPDKTKSARNYIVYALVALVVGFLAKAIVVLVGNMLGVSTPLF